MKKNSKYLMILLALFIFKSGFSQYPRNNKTFNLFSCTDCKDITYIATNSGVKNTPFGLRVGFLCKTGMYIGTRFGEGTVYGDITGNSTKTTLFSITLGLSKPIIIQKSFSMYYFFGGGYGQWWKSRREYWTKEGYELEGGLMFSYKKLMLNLSANMLDGQNAYATWDYTVGVGFRF